MRVSRDEKRYNNGGMEALVREPGKAGISRIGFAK
jgi:hypothetical protein